MNLQKIYKSTFLFLVTLIILGLNQAKALEISVLSKSAQPGQYVTLPFKINADGKFDFKILSPTGWSPLTSSGKLSIKDSAMVAITVKVPIGISANRIVEITLQLSQEDKILISHSAEVKVLPKTGISLYIPKGLKGRIGEVDKFSITVNNLGNISDTVQLRVTGTVWKVNIANEINLEPYESKVVEVEVIASEGLSEGYEHFFIIEAQSVKDSAAKVRKSVSSIYNTSIKNKMVETEGPSITIGLQANLGSQITIDKNGVTPNLFYGATANVSGSLSDFIDFNVNSFAAEGEVRKPFVNYPTNFGFSLTGHNWNTSIGISNKNIRLEGGFKVDAWDFELASAYYFPERNRLAQYNFSTRAISKNPDLDLQIGAGIFGLGSKFTATVGGFYQRDLTEQLKLSLGTSVGYFSQANNDGFDIYFQQGLNWRNKDFAVAQTYAIAPFTNLHKFGVSGRTTTLSPVGFHAKASLTFSNQGTLSENSVTLYAQPFNNLSLSTKGTYTKGIGNTLRNSWSVSPYLSYNFRISSLNGILRAQYTHKHFLSKDYKEDNYQFKVDLNYGQLNFLARGEYALSYSEDIVSNKLIAAAEASYATNNTKLESYFSYEHVAFSNNESTDTYKYGISWEQAWNKSISSKLIYENTPSDNKEEGSRKDSLSAYLRINNFLIDPLSLNLGYTASSSSFWNFQTPLEHNLSASLGITNLLKLPTPSTVVDLFGGRESGEVKGIAFLDYNLNNVKDPQDKPLVNMKILLGSKEVITDIEGRYSFRLSGGTYSFQFPEGLPATVDLLIDKSISLTVNEIVEHNLPFTPVVSLEATIFDDTNHNGQHDEGERGIPYGGIKVKGPLEKQMRANSQGYVVMAGLPAGTYKVFVDNEFLPKRFQATTKEIEISLTIGNKYPRIHLGAALPKRKVVSTFSSNSLAVLATAKPASVPPGAEVVFEALINGNVDSVQIAFDNQKVNFVKEAGRLVARVRLPLDAPTGLLILPVTATRGEDSVTQQAFVTVVQGNPFNNSLITAEVGEIIEFKITTLFEAKVSKITFPTGDLITLNSPDGYSWQGVWSAPTVAKEFEGILIADNEEVGKVSFVAKNKD